MQVICLHLPHQPAHQFGWMWNRYETQIALEQSARTSMYKWHGLVERMEDGDKQKETSLFDWFAPSSSSVSYSSSLGVGVKSFGFLFCYSNQPTNERRRASFVGAKTWLRGLIRGNKFQHSNDGDIRCKVRIEPAESGRFYGWKRSRHKLNSITFEQKLYCSVEKQFSISKLRLDWKTHINPTCSVEQIKQLSSEHLFKTIINPFRTKPNNSLNWKAAPLLSPDNRVHVVPFNPVRPTNTQPAQSSGRWSMVVPFCSEPRERQKANYLFRADPLHWLPTGRQTDSTDRLLQ